MNAEVDKSTQGVLLDLFELDLTQFGGGIFTSATSRTRRAVMFSGEASSTKPTLFKLRALPSPTRVPATVQNSQFQTLKA